VIDGRIAERRREVRQQRQRSRRRRTIVLALSLVVLAGLITIERSPLVALDEIRVLGTERLTEGQVREAAGLDLGTSTLRLRLSAVEARVTELPLVAEAEAQRVDPLTVQIEVRERQPVLVAEGEGTSVLVDREGVVLVEDDLDDVPVVRLAGAPPAPGSEVADDPALANAHAVWRGLSGPLRAEVVLYVADGRDQLTLELARGIEVRFGRAERVDEKVRALGRILEDVGDTPIEAIDVRAPSAPVVVGP
jgi:cell division protein FtsQ